MVLNDAMEAARLGLQKRGKDRDSLEQSEL